MRFFRAIGRLIGLFFKGEFSQVFYRLSCHCPAGIFAYNKSFLLICPPGEVNVRHKDSSNSKVDRVDLSHIDDISCVSGMSKPKIEKLLSIRTKCYLAAVPDKRYSSIIWTSYGRAYVRGMAFDFDIGQNNVYVFGMSRLPEAPVGLGRLLYSEVLEEARARGVDLMYSLVEFTNANALSLHRKMGYKKYQTVYYLKLFGLSFCRTVDTESGKSETRAFVKEPTDDVVII